MQTNHQKDSGLMIQDYVRAKWGRGGLNLSSDELGRKLDPAMRDRVDLLGIDDEKLLGVAPEDVVSRIEKLERDALREDGRVGEHKKMLVTAGGSANRPSSRQSNRKSPPRSAARARR